MQCIRREVLREPSLVRMIWPSTKTYNTRLAKIFLSFFFDISFNFLFFFKCEIYFVLFLNERKVFPFLLRVLLQHLGYPDGKAWGYCICKSDTITPDIPCIHLYLYLFLFYNDFVCICIFCIFLNVLVWVHLYK